MTYFNGTAEQRRKLAARLIELRRKKGISQTVAAQLYGINQTTLSNYEKGLFFPKKPQRQLICDYYGMSEKELFGVSDGKAENKK